MRLIDADALIVTNDGCQETTCRRCKNHITNCEELKDLIRNTPTIEPEQQWIPCSERLPEYRKLVDVTTRDLRVKLAYLDSIEEDGTDDWWIIPLEDAECALWNVVAWMPLPEPYRGES